MNPITASVSSIEENREQPPKKENAKVGSAKPNVARKPAVKPPSKPTKFLPTERIAFQKQLDILRGWAAASGPLGKAVTNNDVAEIVKMQPSTVSMANAFFASTNLLIRTENGYIPAEEVRSFLRNYEWSPDTATQKLAPVLAKTWFAEALLSKLTFGPLPEDECIQNLADSASAAPEYRSQLRILLDYLAAAGLIVKDGNLVKKGNANMTPATPITAVPDPTSSIRQESQPTDMSKNMPSLFGTTEGQVQFNITVKVGMGEFANWQADRIAAFFGGIAQVLAAKAKVEKVE